MRDLPENPEIDELQQVAAELAGVTVADLLSIGPRPDGSLAVVVSPGPKHVYTAEQVAAARAALAAHVADPSPGSAAQPKPNRTRTLKAGPGAESGSRGAVGAGSQDAQSAGATEGASPRAVSEGRPESSEHATDEPRNPAPTAGCAARPGSRARKRGGPPPAPAGGRARRRCP